MNLNVYDNLRNGISIPRVSGGEPVIPLDSDKLVVYSPRERG